MMAQQQPEAFRQVVIDHISSEMRRLQVSSLHRQTKLEDLRGFDWESTLAEFSDKAPTFHSAMEAAMGPR